MKFYVETIGCQYNEYDASRLAIFLKSNGLTQVDNPKNADAIFILACSVRQTAVDRIFGRVRNWQKENKKIFITACVTDEDKKKLAKKGVVYFSDFDHLKSLLALQKTNNDTLSKSDTNFVPIMSGCNNFCSYCVVPYLRGREKSRPMEEIIEEVKELIRSGKKEIVLLGQNVNSYKINQNKKVILKVRRNEKYKSDFAILLEKLNKIPGDFKISFTSNHPKDMTEDIIEAVATLPKVKKEIHLPLQSGSDKILKAMNRPYTSEQYLKLIENCKSKIKNLVLTTDIIVGFPGETEEDFQKTIEVCKKANFNLAYINKYSPRKGTAAYKLGDPIPWKEKKRRWSILDKMINKK